MLLRFLYHTVLGRRILKILINPTLSEYCGRFLDSKVSAILIPFFVKKNKINLLECKEEVYDSFNACFGRKICPEYRPIPKDENILISPCDGLLSAYPIHKNLVVPVKESYYRISDLLQDKELAQEFEGGTCLVFRLCVNHYHRYCYPDSGSKSENIFIPGVLHTVRPIALREYPVFTENCREYTVLDTDHFGKMVQMEVGAMLVGKICNYHGATEIERGREKGRFLYGGSTIILLVKKDCASFSKRHFHSTSQGKEIAVKMGQKIGIRKGI